MKDDKLTVTRMAAKPAHTTPVVHKVTVTYKHEWTDFVNRWTLALAVLMAVGVWLAWGFLFKGG